MQNQPKPTFRFPKGFLDGKFQELDPKVQDALGLFLERLQADPDDPEIKQNCEIDKGRLGYRFTEGFAVYWKVQKELTVDATGLGLVDPIKIDILDVRKITP